MKTVSIAELRKNITKVLRIVEHSKRAVVHVTRYGRVVAVIKSAGR